MSTRLVAKPVRVRRSPATVTAPLGRKSGRRPAVPLEPSRERSGVPCDPPPDPSLRIRSRGRLIPSPYLELPVDARNAGRRRPVRPILPFTAAILAVLLAACSAGAPAATASESSRATSPASATVAPATAPVTASP